jgi:enoyl-CoA hydratase/carnithine racemase
MAAVPERITPPATGEHLVVSNPASHVLLLILNRPKALNAMTAELQEDIERILDWAEAEPEVWFVHVTHS